VKILICKIARFYPGVCVSATFLNDVIYSQVLVTTSAPTVGQPIPTGKIGLLYRDLWSKQVFLARQAQDFMENL
jgi:hypothetical protein